MRGYRYSISCCNRATKYRWSSKLFAQLVALKIFHRERDVGANFFQQMYGFLLTRLESNLLCGRKWSEVVGNGPR